MTPRRGGDHGAGSSRLAGRDLLRVGSLGLRSRRVRALLSALGISIGIAAIVGVLGISQSSKSGLLDELGRLSNLLTVQPNNTAFGQQTELPATAEGMVARIGPVTNVTQIASVANVFVYRNSFVPAIDTNGISVTATDAALPATLGARLAHGAFLNAATARYPAVVLGADAASLLGIHSLAYPTQVWLGGHWFTVVGILQPVQLVSQMDSMAFIGFPIAEQYFGFDGHPSQLYLRTVPSQVTEVYAVLAATVNPVDPATVNPGSPSDVLKAQVAAKGPTTGSSSPWGRWPCSSAGSALPTSWSSPSSNAAPRSACAAPWAPAAATWPNNSWPKPSSSPPWAAWPAPSSAPAPPPSTPPANTGACRSPPSPSTAASAPPSPSAPSPACTPPPEPPASHPPKPSAPSDPQPGPTASSWPPGSPVSVPWASTDPCSWRGRDGTVWGLKVGAGRGRRCWPAVGP